MAPEIEKLLRFSILIVLGTAFLISIPVFAAPSSTRYAAQFAPSLSRVATPQEQTEKRPNPVRRFFSWMKEVVTRPFRKRVPLISDPPFVSVTSSTSSINVCPPATESMDNCPSSREVKLSASAGGPEVDNKLLFMWGVTAGRIRGEGQKVIWDLSDVADGTYTATVEVHDGTGLTANASTAVAIAPCRSCITIHYPCPTIMVDCPDNAKSGQPVTFEAHVYGGDASLKMPFTWSVSAGKISSGKGTSKIIVDVADITSESITATVSIGGLHLACVNTASCTTRTAGAVATAYRHDAKADCQPF